MYNEVPFYSFVGHGQGNYDRQKHVEHQGYKVRPACIGLALAMTVGVIIWSLCDIGLQSNAAPAASAPVIAEDLCRNTTETLKLYEAIHCCNEFNVRCDVTQTTQNRPGAEGAVPPVADLEGEGDAQTPIGEEA